MLKLISFLMMAVVLTVVFNPETMGESLCWTASVGADGHKVYYWEDGQAVTTVDVGAAVTYDMNAITTEGNWYNAYVTGYNTIGESFPSNTVRWQKATEPIVITVPGQPTSVTINFSNQ